MRICLARGGYTGSTLFISNPCDTPCDIFSFCGTAWGRFVRVVLMIPEMAWSLALEATPKDGGWAESCGLGGAGSETSFLTTIGSGALASAGVLTTVLEATMEVVFFAGLWVVVVERTISRPCSTGCAGCGGVAEVCVSGAGGAEGGTSAEVGCGTGADGAGAVSLCAGAGLAGCSLVHPM